MDGQVRWRSHVGARRAVLGGQNAAPLRRAALRLSGASGSRDTPLPHGEGAVAEGEEETGTRWLRARSLVTS
jgi:hypothetical protein